MPAKIEIKGDRGRFYARATGPAVTVSVVEIVSAGHDDSNDLWRSVGPDNGRRIAINKNNLSWLADGNWCEYPYTLTIKEGIMSNIMDDFNIYTQFTTAVRAGKRSIIITNDYVVIDKKSNGPLQK